MKRLSMSDIQKKIKAAGFSGSLNTLGRIFLWLYYWFDLYMQALTETDVGDDDESESEGSGLQRD